MQIGALNQKIRINTCTCSREVEQNCNNVYTYTRLSYELTKKMRFSLLISSIYLQSINNHLAIPTFFQTEVPILSNSDTL